MRRVKYDSDALRKHGIVSVPAEGGVIKATFPGTMNTKPFSVMAQLDGEELVLFPDRSSGHARLLEALCST